MDENIQRVEKKTVRAGNTVQTVQEVSTADTSKASGQTLAVNIIGYLLGLLEFLLAIRFVLALLGANRSNSFAHAIFSLSYPFVKPFFSLFSYSIKYGVSHVEAFTLVAMLVYALVGFGLSRLVVINKRDPSEA